MNDSITTRFHATPLGTMRSTWTAAGLSALGWTNGNHDAFCKKSALSDFLETCLTAYFQSGVADFQDVPIDTDEWSSFERDVFECCRSIPAGRTWTYKKLATKAGHAGANRAVGAAMARNRILLIVPCHRVICSEGGLSGFSALGGVETKRYLLDLETRQMSFDLEASC